MSHIRANMTNALLAQLQSACEASRPDRHAAVAIDKLHDRANTDRLLKSTADRDKEDAVQLGT